MAVFIKYPPQHNTLNIHVLDEKNDKVVTLEVNMKNMLLFSEAKNCFINDLNIKLPTENDLYTVYLPQYWNEEMYKDF